MNLREVRAFYNTKPVEFIVRQDLSVNEDNSYVPRFGFKKNKEIVGVPINEPIKPSQELLVKAIRYGMIFLINYKGAEDKHFAGHERVIYPMVLGRSSKGKFLIRGYHLNGWSVSSNRHVNKIWRMFRLDRVLSVTFTGSFYRLPPQGYNMNDKGMRGGIIAKADFSEIRKNQQSLLKAQEIQNKEEITLSEENKSFVTIKVKPTETKIDLNNPLENAFVNNMKDIANIRISFLKSLYGNKYISVVGALGQPGNSVKAVTDKGKDLGVYKVLDSIAGETLKKIKNVKGNSIFDVYLFDSKL